MIQWAHLSMQERVEAIRPLWLEGKSAREISSLFVGCTRNSIIGYVFRHQLEHGMSVGTARASNGKTVGRRQPRSNNFAAINMTRRPRVQAVRREAAFEPLPGSSPIPWTERAFGQCAWPVGGEGADMLSCGFACGQDVYCPDHVAIRRGVGSPSERRAAETLQRYGQYLARVG